MDIEHLAGTRLGNYEIESLISRGGMGVVYKARQISLNRPVALKILASALSSNSSLVKRFHREAQAIARLHHPNIVQIYDIQEDKNLHFFSMQYMEGQTLTEILKEKGKLDIDEAIGIITQAAQGIEHVHKNGIIHRDIKSSNIIVNDSGNVKVMDFGLARSTEERSKLTKSGTIMGTVDYMSPEQARGELTLDFRTDIWSLGVVLYEMLTGKVPFSAANDSAVIHKIIYEDPVDITTLNPDVPQRLRVAVARAMRKRAADRYTSITEFLKDLSTMERLDATQDVQARRHTDTRPITMVVTEEAATLFVTEQTPFVGRKGELAELRQLLDRSASGRGSLVMIGGEPGVGKTRLTSELLAEAQRYGFLYLSGHCYEMEGMPPYIPFVEMIESAARTFELSLFRRLLGNSASEVAKLMPELRHKFADMPESPTLPPEQERRYMFNGILEFIARAAQVEKLLLVFEDLHWADESTMLLLQHISPQLVKMPVLLIGTYRDTELAMSESFVRMQEALVRQRLVHYMILKQLSEEEVSEMLWRRTGQQPPRRLVKVIYQKTEGNPFFVEEIFRHLTAEKKLFDLEGQWRADLRIYEADVPRGVRLIVGHRLERVSKQCQEMLAIAAVIGRAVSFDLLEESAKLKEDALLNTIDEAERAQLIRSAPSAGDVEFVFAHELVRQTLLSDLSMLRRQRFHLRVADAIEQVHANDLDKHATQLAYHLHQAGKAANPARTIGRLKAAGDKALSAAAFEDALSLYNKAHSLQSSDDMRAQADLLYRRGLAQRSLGHWEKALSDWRETLAIYEELGDSEAMGQTCADLTVHLIGTARYGIAFETVNRGLAALGEHTNSARCLLLAALAMMVGHMQEDGYESASGLFGQAIEMAEHLKDDRVLGAVLARKTHLHHEHWEGLESAELGIKSAGLLLATGNPYEASFALCFGGYCGLIWCGRLDEAAGVGARTEAIAKEIGNDFALWNKGHYDSLREMAKTGDLAKFLQARKELLEFSLNKESGWASVDHAALGRGQFWCGLWQEAQESFQQAAELGVYPGYCQSLLLLLAAYSGDREAVLGVLERNKESLPQPNRANTYDAWTMLEAAIEGLAMIDEREKAAALYPLALEAVATRNLIRASYAGVVQTTAGIAAAAGRQWEKAEDHYTVALNQAHDIPHKIEQPEVRRWYARMLIERNAPGDIDKARTLLSEAVAMYREFGMPKHLKMAEDLLEKV